MTLQGFVVFDDNLGAAMTPNTLNAPPCFIAYYTVATLDTSWRGLTFAKWRILKV